MIFTKNKIINPNPTTTKKELKIYSVITSILITINRTILTMIITTQMDLITITIKNKLINRRNEMIPIVETE
jgi:hypothetical protein